MTWQNKISRKLRQLFWRDKVAPVTHETVMPAELPAESQREVRIITTKAAREVERTSRKAWEARHALAKSALAIVSGAQDYGYNKARNP